MPTLLLVLISWGIALTLLVMSPSEQRRYFAMYVRKRDDKPANLALFMTIGLVVWVAGNWYFWVKYSTTGCVPQISGRSYITKLCGPNALALLIVGSVLPNTAMLGALLFKLFTPGVVSTKIKKLLAVGGVLAFLPLIQITDIIDATMKVGGRSWSDIGINTLAATPGFIAAAVVMYKRYDVLSYKPPKPQ